MSTTKAKNTFAVSMFDQIRDSLKTEKKAGNQNFKDIMKFVVGNTYLVRLVPNIKDPNRTFYHYFSHGWSSMATGQYMSGLCPSTHGGACPIDNERFKIWKTGTEQEKEAAKVIKRKENWMVNAFVVNDPVTPENNGKVMILRYGAQLNKIIDAAINGDDVDEFGSKIFDLTEKGCNLRIKVESNAEGKRSWPTYASSKFLSASEIPGMTGEKIEEVYSQLHDLEKMETPKTTEQLQEMLDIHFYGKVKPAKSESANGQTKQPTDAEDDDFDLSPSSLNQESDTSADSAIDELLKDL